jgi:hypothetical protein
MKVSIVRRNPYGAPSMKWIFRQPEKVRGYVVPRRRFTIWAALYFTFFVCLPVLAIAVAFDTLLYVTIDNSFGTCLSVLCWAG